MNKDDISFYWVYDAYFCSFCSSSVKVNPLLSPPPPFSNKPLTLLRPPPPSVSGEES